MWDNTSMLHPDLSNKLVDIFGDQTKVANALGVSRQAVWSWMYGGAKTPIKSALLIEKLTQRAVTSQMLRPDLFDQNGIIPTKCNQKDMK
jgi:DNA-binding transcriptional regulator YdaS (Cro superfamily)